MKESTGVKGHVDVNNITEEGIRRLQKIASDAVSDKGAMAGSLGAITRYLDTAGVPPMSSVQKRVKLLAAMYEQSEAERKRLQILVADRDEP